MKCQIDKVSLVKLAYYLCQNGLVYNSSLYPSSYPLWSPSFRLDSLGHLAVLAGPRTSRSDLSYFCRPCGLVSLSSPSLDSIQHLFLKYCTPSPFYMFSPFLQVFSNYITLVNECIKVTLLTVQFASIHPPGWPYVFWASFFLPSHSHEFTNVCLHCLVRH
jgi:hypothetical protein